MDKKCEINGREHREKYKLMNYQTIEKEFRVHDISIGKYNN